MYCCIVDICTVCMYVSPSVMKDMSRNYHGEEFEAIVNAYVECYSFVVSKTLNSSQNDSCEDNNTSLEPLIMKVCIIFEKKKSA